MSKRWLVVGSLVGLALVAGAAAPWRSQALEYKFVTAGSWSTDDQGQRVGLTDKATTVANELSQEGWSLASASATDGDGGRFLVLAFSRPTP